jgi:hypothetical protein
MFSVNPNAKDGRNSVCVDCRGRSEVTTRGKRRALAEGRVAGDLDAMIDQVFDEMFKSGDPARDFFRKHLLKLMLTAKNEQTQLRAMELLTESLGINKETPTTEKDLIHTAFMRLKEQAAK